MRYLFKLLYEDTIRIVKKPKRITNVLSLKKLRAYKEWTRARLMQSEPWIDSNRAFIKRPYRTYEDYIRHQKSKLEFIDLSQYDVDFRRILRERLERANLLRNGMIVLCLAARIGTEVKAFLDIGCFAIGIDLNPGENNRYVVYGDFHNIQFPSNSVDVIFTNSLDHAFDVTRLIEEIKRVLKPNGLLIIEAIRGKEEGFSPGWFESFWWSKIDDLVSLFENSQLKLIKRVPFIYPGPGEQLCFEKEM